MAVDSNCEGPVLRASLHSHSHPLPIPIPIHVPRRENYLTSPQTEALTTTERHRWPDHAIFAYQPGPERRCIGKTYSGCRRLKIYKKSLHLHSGLPCREMSELIGGYWSGPVVNPLLSLPPGTPGLLRFCFSPIIFDAQPVKLMSSYTSPIVRQSASNPTLFPCQAPIGLSACSVPYWLWHRSADTPLNHKSSEEYRKKSLDSAEIFFHSSTAIHSSQPVIDPTFLDAAMIAKPLWNPLSPLNSRLRIDAQRSF